MPRRIVTVTHPDGTKKVIVGQSSNNEPVKTTTSEPVKTRTVEDKRPKPETPFTGLTKERNGYKHGGKVKFKTR
jgi:hypothetical protein